MSKLSVDADHDGFHVKVELEPMSPEKCRAVSYVAVMAGIIMLARIAASVAGALGLTLVIGLRATGKILVTEFFRLRGTRRRRDAAQAACKRFAARQNFTRRGGFIPPRAL